MQSKYISVLMPTYNRSHIILDSIKSIQVQKKPENYDILIIIYDDGSTDDTEHVINDYISSNNIENIIYYNSNTNMNLGVGSSRNKLFNICNILIDSGVCIEYICWLDSDDFMCEDRLDICSSFLDKNPEIDIVFSDIILDCDNTSDVLTIDINKYDKFNYSSIEDNNTSITGVFRYTILKYKFQNLRYGRENDLFLYDLVYNDVKIAHINLPLYLFRIHDGCIIKNNKNNNKFIENNKIKEYLKSKLKI